jgi:hypothetical protein
MTLIAKIRPIWPLLIADEAVELVELVHVQVEVELVELEVVKLELVGFELVEFKLVEPRTRRSLKLADDFVKQFSGWKTNVGLRR